MRIKLQQPNLQFSGAGFNRWPDHNMVTWRFSSGFTSLSSPSRHNHHLCPYSNFSNPPSITRLPFPFQFQGPKSIISLAALKLDLDIPTQEIQGDNLEKENKILDFDDDEGDLSGIQVPRAGYIPVSKTQLLDAILCTMFSSKRVGRNYQEEEEANQFRLLSSCLDSVLHAEHKSVLEEMRLDFNSAGHVVNMDDTDSLDINDKEPESSMPTIDYGFNLRKLFVGSSASNRDVKRYGSKSRVALATRFQRAFMQLLSNAQFEELSARDLMLTSSLNTDYLLTLPINVDWKRAYESNAIIFRRGYAIERQKGLLIGEKLDYIQSIILQRLFFLISKPLGQVAIWISETLKNAFEKTEVRVLTERLRLWIRELSLIKKSYYKEEMSDNMVGADELSNSDLPMWLAAQRAIPRYEGLLSSDGPRGRLLRKLLMWTGLVTPTQETPFEIDEDITITDPYLRPICLPRISLSDIWKPATRKYYGNDLWKIMKTSVSVFFSRSALQEPAFQELILMYTDEMEKQEIMDKAEIPSLRLKIYDRIPIPDLPVVFPHKKLSFRIIDTVRLDAATILGLLAYFINYKFEDILSSPSAVLLDAVAVSALILSVTRVVLGYKQTWDRYQLLVNKTLYEKTVASGFGAVHFLLDASEQQQYKEAILAYAVLLKAGNNQVNCRSSIGDKCERFIYDTLKMKVKMPIDKAMDTLLRLGLVTETNNGSINLQVLSCSEAYVAIKRRWNSLLNKF